MGKVHSPFLYHLRLCCRENDIEMAASISERIIYRTEEIYQDVKKIISGKQTIESDWSALTREFKKFVEKMESQLDQEKNPQYCMFKFYKQIAKIDQHLMAPANQRPEITQLDLRVIERFYKVYRFYYQRNAEAIIPRRLKEMFDKLRDGKEINAIQEDIFDFLLTDFFSQYNNVQEDLLSIIKSKKWDEVAFGSFLQQKDIENALIKDSRYEQVHALFNSLQEKLLDDIEDIRQILVNISRLLDRIYDDICNGIILTNVENDPIEYDPVDDQIISYLHSHIIAFMRWIPMVPQDNLGERMMLSVDNVIDKIKEKVYEIVDSDDNIKKRLYTHPDTGCDTIFVQGDETELRRLLIGEMYNEQGIVSCFRGLYKFDTSAVSKGGKTNG